MNRRVLSTIIACALLFGAPVATETSAMATSMFPIATAISPVATVISLLPGARLLAQVPTYEDVVSRPLGQRLTEHHEMVTYLRRVAEASPRVAVEIQGRSWEGRELMLAIVTSPENHARLEEIRRGSLRLDDPRSTSPDEAQRLIGSQPAIVWFGGSIHGNESSGAEGALMLLERLSTGQDAATLEALDHVVVLIDPMLNPDGRDAWAQYNHRRVGRVPSPERDNWANDVTGWEGVGFRTGHYYFDNNRDWFAQTQPETRHRAATWRRWRPQVVVDMHEMGVDEEFFFYPGAEPVTPHVQGFPWIWVGRFADAYAAAFDSSGVEYMTREAFDYFYPGYTDGYASHLGSVGMLYEQGSSRGLAIERSDGTVRTLADGARQQYTAAWTAVRTAAMERERLLREYYEGLVADIEEGGSGTRRYLIEPSGDPSLRAELTEILLRAGAEIAELQEPSTLRGVADRTGRPVGERRFPAGTWVVELAQPRGRAVRALLSPETPVPEGFVQEARERLERGESAEFYDITAWSLPLLFDLDVFGSTDATTLAARPLEPEEVRLTGTVSRRASYAYLLDGRNARSISAMLRLLERGYTAGMVTEATRIDGVEVPRGTVVIRTGTADDGLHEAVVEVAERYGLRVDAVDSGYGGDEGVSLGSSSVISVKRPTIGILAEGPVRGYSFGWAWHALDRQYEIPVTPLRVGSVAGRPLDGLDALVVPSASSGALARELGERGVDRLRRWVQDGGTLVTLGGATDFALDSAGLDLVALRSWYDTEKGEDAQRLSVPGSIVRALPEEAYWITAGLHSSELPVLVNGSRVYLEPEPPPSGSRRPAVRFAPAGNLRISGHLWSESASRLGGAVFLYEERVGAGRVIAFAEDPNYRGFWRGVDRLFLNAVVAGPSAP